MSINNIEHLESLATKDENEVLKKGFDTLNLIFVLIKNGSVELLEELENGRK